MAEIKYLDFDLLIERSGENTYRIRALTSSAGRAVSEITLPFTDMELENFLLKIGCVPSKFDGLPNTQFRFQFDYCNTKF